jgi:RNA polymerase sigma-70 factor (ECF subfamily)
MWERVKEISYDKSRSYLFTTAYHTLIDGLRKDRFRASWDDIPEETGSGEQYSDLREVLDEALDRLPEIQRSVLLLRDYEGYSYEEIGEITGLSDSQVKVYIFRARLTLKNYIVSLDLVI